MGYVRKVIQEPMLLLLLSTAVIYFIIGQAWDGLLMIGGVLLMIGIDLYQENKTDKALEALKGLTTPKITVVRAGRLQEIGNEELVNDDLLLVREGERVAGDGILLESASLSLDESMLTGESGAIFKTNSDRVFAGTLVLSGQGVVKITAIGALTQYGKIGQSLAAIHEPPTPLQKKTAHLVKIFGLTGFLACAAMFAINLINTRAIVDSLLRGLTLAISVIPEELPVILTVFAALGAYRLSKKGMLVKKINSIETLGSMTSLCTDKTGTLTLNHMQLHILSDGQTAVKASSLEKTKENQDLLAKAVLACPSEPFDPADLSIMEIARRVGLDLNALRLTYKPAREYGFDQTLKFMGIAWSGTDDGYTLAIKGSAEDVVGRCPLSPDRKKNLLREIERLAQQGLRVLAVAQKHLPKTPHNLGSQDGYEFVGLLGFHDPPKPGAKQAVSACRRAGITVRMITGDHPQTALHIAEAIGLQHDGKVISGSEIQNLSDQDLVQRIKNAKVFARIIPEQKLRIVHALQSGGEIVGMIGDGVNDAPSLKEADVSIAMGKQGTNVAREAADMVLTDDELDTVVNAIHDGRRIYDNIQKAISYVFGIHIYIILTALIIPLLGLSPLLLPIHIILLELIIDPTCSLVFESMPAEPDVMKRPPREPERPIISAKQFVRIVAGGLAVFALTAGTYVAALRFGLTTDAARTLGFSVILWSNLFQVLGQISKEKLTIMVLGFFKNKVFLSVYLSVFTLVLALIYLPYLNTLFGFSSVPIILLALTVLIGFVPTLGNDIYKKITRAV